MAIQTWWKELREKWSESRIRGMDKFRLETETTVQMQTNNKIMVWLVIATLILAIATFILALK